MFNGRVPTPRCLPAGAMRQPFGNSTLPSSSLPGTAEIWGGLDCATVRTAVHIAPRARRPHPTATRRIVVGETTPRTMNELFVVETDRQRNQRQLRCKQHSCGNDL